MLKTSQSKFLMRKTHRDEEKTSSIGEDTGKWYFHTVLPIRNWYNFSGV